jgi:hypothetical protein
MSAATPFVPGADYSADVSPGDLGNALDADFDDLKLTTDQIRANQALVQRDDGLPANATIHPDSFTTASLALIASDWTPRGLWLTATVYAIGDVVEESGTSYVCAVAHTSGTFATDDTAGKWVQLSDRQTLLYAAAGGTADVITAGLPITVLEDGRSYFVSAAAANATTTPTLNAASLGAKTIVKNGNQALVAGDIFGSGHVLHLVYRSGIGKFELLNPGQSISAYIKTLNVAASAAAARVTLDVPSNAEAVLDAIFDAKGDLLVATAADTPARKAAGSDGKILVPSSGATDGLAWVDMGIAMWNGVLSASVGSNALTLQVLTNAGAAPSDADPVFVAFRDVTLTSGQFVVRKLTAALSIVVPDTATLGTANGVAARLYCFLADEAGSVRIGVWNPYNSTGPTLVGLDESDLMTSTLIGVGSDSAQTAYTNDAVTAVAFRTIGYCEISEATAGTWATAPTKVHTLKPSDARTGDKLQMKYSATGVVATGTTLLPLDNTIPQITEGNQYMSLAVTPSNTINLLQIDVQAAIAASVSNDMGGALFQDATANALVAASVGTAASNQQFQFLLSHLMRAATVSETTFRFRAGGNSAGTTTFNGKSGAIYGGSENSFMRITEIFT